MRKGLESHRVDKSPDTNELLMGTWKPHSSGLLVEQQKLTPLIPVTLNQRCCYLQPQITNHSKKRAETEKTEMNGRNAHFYTALVTMKGFKHTESCRESQSGQPHVYTVQI